MARLATSVNGRSYEETALAVVSRRQGTPVRGDGRVPVPASSAGRVLGGVVTRILVADDVVVSRWLVCVAGPNGSCGCSVVAARRLGAERIILMGRPRTAPDLGRDFGATDIVAERGGAGIERVRELTGATVPTPCWSASG